MKSYCGIECLINRTNRVLKSLSTLPILQFWQFSILATCNFGNLQFWQLAILATYNLTTFNPNNFQFWQFSILAIFKQIFLKMTEISKYLTNPQIHQQQNQLYGSCDQKLQYDNLLKIFDPKFSLKLYNGGTSDWIKARQLQGLDSEQNQIIIYSYKIHFWKKLFSFLQGVS